MPCREHFEEMSGDEIEKPPFPTSHPLQGPQTITTEEVKKALFKIILGKAAGPYDQGCAKKNQKFLTFI